MIYFARHLYGGPIKIGCSIAVGARLKSLQREYRAELKILGVMNGSLPDEKLLHRFFSSFKVVGEWFVPSRTILDFIAINATSWDGIDPPAPIFPEREYQTIAGASRLLGMSSHRLKQHLHMLRIPTAYSGKMMIVKTRDLNPLIQKEA